MTTTKEITIGDKAIEITLDRFDNILLYRGDRGSIHRFKTALTRASNIYGPGIYLTTDISVAAGYRNKGGPLFYNDSVIVLANSKEELMALIRNKYFQRVDPFGNYLAHPWKRRISRQHRIVIENKWATDQYKYRDVIYINNDKWCVDLSTIFPKAGCVTVFNFPYQELLQNTLDVNQNFGCLPMEIRTEIIREFAQFVPSPDSTISQIRDSRISQIRDSRILNKYYKGLRYLGGQIVGNVNHLVFILWHDDYVNFHRLRSIR